MHNITQAGLYGIVDFGYVPVESMEKATSALLTGGVDILQLRAKGIPLKTVSEVAKRIVPLCKYAGIPFILNDHPELAAEVGADGVHIGQDDGVISHIRNRIPEGMLIGRSTHSLAQARQALAEGADYIGFGPLFPTPTKAGRPSIGLDQVAEMEQNVGSRIPAFCIGGIKPENLAKVLAAGARRCVIVSHLLTAPNISEATRVAKSSIAPL